MSKPRIAIIGGGFSGICAGAQLQKQLGPNSVEFTIFDENEDFGGVWLVNKYPGCACEIPSHMYSFSFEQNPNWTSQFAPQTEIQAYLAQVAKKYGLYEKSRFKSQVVEVEWLETVGKWNVQILDKTSGETEQVLYDYIIVAVGALRTPLLPPDFQNFKGQIMHSAEWDSSIDLRGKKVGVVGSGASALQIVPELASKAAELHSYQRSPNWIHNRIQFEIPAVFQKLFLLIPLLMWLFRLAIYVLQETQYRFSLSDSIFNHYATWTAKLNLRRQVKGDPSLIEGLTPDYKLGCKRILGSANFYRTFLLPQVHLHRGEIEKIEGNRITAAGGTTHELDVLILATGFRIQDGFAPLKVKGKGGVDIASKWMTEGIRHYYGVVSSCIPNFFFVMGPNTGVGHQSVIFMIECHVSFLIRLIQFKEGKGAKSIVVRESAEEQMMSAMFKAMKSSVWDVETCGGWFKDGRGVTTALWSGTTFDYWRQTKNIDFANFDLTF